METKPFKFGLYFKSSASSPLLLDSVYSTLSEAEQASSKLFEELSTHLTWPGYCVLVQPINSNGEPILSV
jgi:hypothetical protein